MDKLVIEEILQILCICRTVTYLLRIRHLTCHLVHIRLALQIGLRHTLARQRIHCMELLQIGRRSVKSDPLLVRIAVHTAVDTRK